MRPALLAVLVLSLASSAAAAAAGLNPTVLASDSTRAGTPSTVATYFLAGESAASWFSAPCDGSVVGAQVYWASVAGDSDATLEEAITFYAAGTFPAPGPVLKNVDASPAVVSRPLLRDGVMNEYRHTDPRSDTGDIDIRVSAGEAFSVGIELRNPSAGLRLAPGIALDLDGCRAGTNTVNVLSEGWADACELGVAGDWVIRAIVECPAVAGSHALPSPGRPGYGTTALILLGMGGLAALPFLLRGARPGGGYGKSGFFQPGGACSHSGGSRRET